MARQEEVYDDSDAVSPLGDDEAPARERKPVRDRVGGPIGRAWAFFNAQPAQTKILIVGVIVVVGVVVWMMFRKKADTSTSSEDDTTGQFTPLGANRFGPGLQAAPPTALPPPITNTPVTPPISPGATTSASAGPGVPVTVPKVTPTVTPTPTPVPTAFRPPATFPVTPEGSKTPPTMHRTDVPLSGTITPITRPATGHRQDVAF